MEEIERIRSELDTARQNLNRTVADVSQKIEAIGAEFEPKYLIQRHLTLATMIAGSVGFMMGSRAGKSALTALVLGGVVGMMLKDTDAAVPES